MTAEAEVILPKKPEVGSPAASRVRAIEWILALKNGLKLVFEDFFIHKQNPDGEYGYTESQKLYIEFFKTSDLVPEEAAVTAGHHLPWEIIV